MKMAKKIKNILSIIAAATVCFGLGDCLAYWMSDGFGHFTAGMIYYGVCQGIEERVPYA